MVPVANVEKDVFASAAVVEDVSAVAAAVVEDVYAAEVVVVEQDVSGAAVAVVDDVSFHLLQAVFSLRSQDHPDESETWQNRLLVLLHDGSA